MVKKYLFIIVLPVFFTACHKKQLSKFTSTSEVKQTIDTTKTDIKNVIVDVNADILNTGNSYEIENVAIKGDILSIFINYSGGCKEHSFELVSNGMYAKSLPPQIKVSLKHNSNEDMCRKLMTEEVKFNVTALKYNGTGNVIIILGDKQINYFK